MAAPELKDPLVRFDLVRLDIRDERTPLVTPDGQRTTPAQWARQLAVSASPALVFFAPNGQEVLKTDALVLRQRLKNSLNFVLDKAYAKGMTYQRYARTEALEKFAAATDK